MKCEFLIHVHEAYKVKVHVLQCYRAKRKVKNFASTDVKMHRQTQDSEYGAPLI